MNSKLPWWIGMGFMAIGLLMMAKYAAVSLFGENVDGVVIAETKEVSNESVSRYANLRFVDPTTGRGVQERVTLPPWYHCSLEQRIPLKYWRSFPDGLIINSFLATWAVPIAVFLIGCFAVFMSYFAARLLADTGLSEENESSRSKPTV